MKIYLDQCIIDEWIKFKIRGCSSVGYTKSNLENLHAIGKILDKASELSVEFMISAMNDLERSSDKERSIDQFISKYNVKKVPSFGISICMVDHDQELPIENFPEIGKAQSSGARKIVAKRIKCANDIKKIRREKFGDFIHIDSAIKAGADIFLTMDGKLLRNKTLSAQLSDEKMKIISPKDFHDKL
ncbi:MAG: hypothetical protein NT047_04210 [Deltaproteobacteria bacterium]|nr:hypothetical protein [Deltaproteobacteria bacterium]